MRNLTEKELTLISGGDSTLGTITVTPGGGDGGGSTPPGGVPGGGGIVIIGHP